MARLLKLAIPLLGVTTVVPLKFAPVGLDANPIVMAPVNELLILPRESRATTSTGGEMARPTLAELGCTKNPSTGGELVPPLPPLVPVRPEPVPLKQAPTASRTSVGMTRE